MPLHPPNRSTLAHVPQDPMPLATRRVLPVVICAAAVLGLTACADMPIGRAAQVATGYTSHLLCDDVFIAGLDPARAFDDRIRPLPGMAPVAWALQPQVDRARHQVTVTLAGGFESRARFDERSGCQVLAAADGLSAAPGLQREPPTRGRAEDPQLTVTSNRALRVALDRAMTDVAGQPAHGTKAIVVLHDGRRIAERYAPGYGVDTPMLGFSATKSLTNALVGILVRQGRLRWDQPAPLAAWSSPTDPRHAITVEQLLRQTSGLDLPQDNSGFDRTSQIMYSVHDKAGAAAEAALAAAPGTRWAYTDTNFMLLSRLVRDTVGGGGGGGGDGGDRVRQFMQTELIEPLGLTRLRIDFDATGTPIGSSHALATARDWARLGQLYLDDGRVGDAPNGQRILPAGWVARSVTPTLATGYGAGWWTNRVPGPVPGWGVPWGLSRAPADTFFARGFMGQYVVVVPSRRLVIVRLSVSHQRGDDIDGTNTLVGEVLDALEPPGGRP
jgi:CubicO group peptidase (beta-lactamase class C family)